MIILKIKRKGKELLAAFNFKSFFKNRYLVKLIAKEVLLYPVDNSTAIVNRANYINFRNLLKKH